MAYRSSRLEKGKWIPDPSKESRRPPIRIPQENTATLIEENRFTLIGRVTNPKIQKTRALVDFFLQQWRVTGTITGRDLGPNLFQFKFESEQDLQAILAKAPFHFKRWMMILQRWEPVVSDFFPALIPFWITVHGIPLHYWTEKALEAIGTELGPVERFDVGRGRMRVLINGLKPLEMKLEISVAGVIKQVELEYEDLQKHCFICHSLSHDRDECPSLRAQANIREPGPRMGISQARTMERLDADRRRADERRKARSDGSQWQRPLRHELEWKHDKDFRVNYGARRDPYYKDESLRPEESERSCRRPAKERLSLSKDTNYVSHSRHNFQTPRTEWRPIEGDSHLGNNSKAGALSSVSHTPSPKPIREGEATASKGVSTNRQVSGEGSAPSQERRSALNRLSLPKERVPLLQEGVANADSGRLQEIDPQLVEQGKSQGGNSVPSSSRNPNPPRNIPYDASQERSPIRTLSEDRVHVSLRLGPLFHSEDDESLINLQPANNRRSTTKAAVEGDKTKKRGSQSTAPGTSVKRRRVTKNYRSPKSIPGISVARKPSSKDLGNKDAGPSTATGTAQPRSKIIPATRKQGTDFRSGPNPLP
ncbi:hypothetical protein Bca4012_021621 [Brassica carinata]